jgi:endo-1,4-beta-xylanase
MLLRPSRRQMMALAAVSALGACERPRAEASPLDARLKDVSPTAVGVSVMTDQLSEMAYVDLLTRHFNQITPEWEMKMEAILGPDGGLDFAAADRLAEFARARGLKLHGHALVWYSQEPKAYRLFDGDRPRMTDALKGYIRAVAGRYRGLARGWDVVNEPVSEEGGGYRDCVWRRTFGMDYVRLAFEWTREADPDAVLFLNDYNLEYKPAKLDSFQRLVESLLKAGAPLSGLGAQTHLLADIEPRQAGRAIRELAKFGLPIHVSELDVSTRQVGARLPGGPSLLDLQARTVDAVARAYLDLPVRQQYALTVWGLRDRDSWLRRPPYDGDGSDTPLLFDDAGRPKPAFDALARALAA